MSKIFLVILTFYFIPNFVLAQSVLDEVNDSGGQGSPELFTEKIIKISASKKIFILTNESSGFDKGDFISLLLNSNLVTRCLVAKTHNKQSGIKILKIYNVDLWNTLRPGIEVQVLRGEDGYFKKRPAAEAAKDPEKDNKIKTEDDLFNSTSLEDDGNVDENANRHIKTDNIVTLTYGQIAGVDTDGSAKRYGHPAFQWAYQFADNIWAEAGYGQNVVKDFPAQSLDTKMSSITFKVKYTFAAPFYSFIKPYIGYQIINASSPGAGQETSPGNPPADQLNKEVELVDSLKKNTIIGGVTLLKRLVPGWFVRADLGTDIYSLGFGLEF